MARRRRSTLGKVLHDMHPKRVLWRGMSGPEAMSGLRSLWRPTTRTSPAARKKAVAAMERKAAKAAPAKKSAAKKTAAPMGGRVLRGKGGRLAGSKPALSVDDQAVYLRAKNRDVDPELRIRNSRTRRG